MNSQGFTLIELLVVVGLLALISGAAVVAYKDGDVDASVEMDVVRHELNEIRKALLQFRRDVGYFPDAAGELAAADRLALLRRCDSDDDANCTAWDRDRKRGWNGPYLMSNRVNRSTQNPLLPDDPDYPLYAVRDPWFGSNHADNYYTLEDPDSDAPGSGMARIVSRGPDGQAGNDDDIVLYLVQ